MSSDTTAAASRARPSLSWLLKKPSECHSETRSPFERGEESAFFWPFAKSRSLALLGTTRCRSASSVVAGVHKSLKLLQLGESGAGIDGLSGQMRAGAEIFGETRDNESGCRVDNNDVARGAGVPLEDPTDEIGILVRIPTTERFKRCPCDAKLLGSDHKVSDAALAHFRDGCLLGERNFIQPAAMNHEGASRTQFQESCGYQIEDFLGKNPQHLPVCSGRVREWPQ